MRARFQMRLTLMKKENKNMTEHNIVIGSRGSRLAVIQSEMVRDFIREKKPGCQVEILTMKTTNPRSTRESSGTLLIAPPSIYVFP